MRNPLVLNVCNVVKPYLVIDYLPKDMVIKDSDTGDEDVMDGYIPYTTVEEKGWERGIRRHLWYNLKNLIKSYNYEGKRCRECY